MKVVVSPIENKPLTDSFFMTEQTQTTGRSTTAIVLALIFFFPLGFYWVYNQPGWSVGKKWLFVIPV